MSEREEPMAVYAQKLAVSLISVATGDTSDLYPRVPIPNELKAIEQAWQEAPYESEEMTRILNASLKGKAIRCRGRGKKLTTRHFFNRPSLSLFR